MINISNSKHLDIILPNTNKALAEVLKSASPTELESLVKGRDLKSVLSSILQQSANNPSMDKELLTLVKNNPTLKNLGDVSSSIKDLLTSIKSDKNLAPLEKVLTSFLTDLKDLKNTELKQKLENSGVFLESKLKDVKNPIVELKSTLESLLKELKPSDIASNKTVPKQIQELLNTNLVKSASPSVLKDASPTALKQMASDVQSLVTKLQTAIKSADAIHSPVIAKAIDKLQHLIDPEVMSSQTPAPKLDSLKAPLQLISQEIQKNPSPQAKEIVGTLEKISTQIKNIEKAIQTPLTQQTFAKQLNSDIQTLVNKLSTTLQNTQTNTPAPLQQAVEKLEKFIDSKLIIPQETKTIANKEIVDLKTLGLENFKLSSIKEPLEQISLQMQKSFTAESKGILGALEKIFATLKTIEQSALTPKASLEQLISKNVPKEINQLSDTIKSVIQKADPIFKQETLSLVSKLEYLNTPQKLAPNQHVQEILSKDLKAVLLQSAEEIKSSNNPNQTEILKHIDKLSLQIDNYQLISHLSNASSLYLPFSWDMLEEGNIEMKKAKDEKFYCDIDLKLKEYGELNIKMSLYEKNQLNLHIYSANEEFKTILKENIASLRSALIETNITPREIRIFEPKQKVQASPYGVTHDDFKMGFEVKA